MRRHIVILTGLLILQAISAVFLVGFYPHAANIWYKHQQGWWTSFQLEHQQGGIMMMIEIIVILLVVGLTIAYEIWQLVSQTKEMKEIKALLVEMAKTLKRMNDEGVKIREVKNGNSNTPTDNPK